MAKPLLVVRDGKPALTGAQPVARQDITIAGFRGRLLVADGPGEDAANAHAHLVAVLLNAGIEVSVGGERVR